MHVAAEGDLDDSLTVYSIGHSNTPVDRLLSLLETHGIEVIADVRTFPRSRYVPHFDAKPLQASLSSHGVKYVFLGDELGGRPDGDDFYDDEGHVRYDVLARSDRFNDGLDRLLRGAKDFRVAILCSEEDPSQCHRHLLIGRVLADRNVRTLHIRGDGSIISEEHLVAADAADRAAQGALFGTPSEDRWRSIRSVSRRRAHLSSSDV